MTKTRILTDSEPDLRQAAGLLRDGALVAFPTETVYGLGADATNARAVAGIYEAKGRPSFNPLIAHVADTASALKLGQFDATALRLAERFWPGPLTLVVPKSPQCPVSEIATAGHDSVALRVPSHPLAQRLLAYAGVPVVAPSANRSGHVSATRAAHVLADLDGRIDAVVDGGAASVGVESTIVACLGDGVRLLRPGGLAREEIEAALGTALLMPDRASSGAVLAPGMLVSHYAPDAPVRLDATDVRAGEAWLGFGPLQPTGATPAVSLNLSPSGDLIEAAAGLFEALRALDLPQISGIAVAPVQGAGVGEAIRDRLRRAAADR